MKEVGHLEPLVKELGHALEGALNNPEDRHKRGGERVGFVLLLFDFGESGSFSYLSNADRADTVRFLKEAREKIGAETQ